MIENVIIDCQEIKIINMLYMDITGFTWEINILGLMLTIVTQPWKDITALNYLQMRELMAFSLM